MGGAAEARAGAPARAAWRQPAVGAASSQPSGNGGGSETGAGAQFVFGQQPAQRQRADTAGGAYPTRAEGAEATTATGATGAAAGRGAAVGAKGWVTGGGKSAPGRGGANRRRGAEDRERVITTRDDGLRELLLLLSMLVHQTAARTRELMGCSCDTWLLPTTSTLARRLKAEMAAFTTRVNEWRINRDRALDSGEEPPPAMGNPSVLLFREMIDALQDEDVGQANKDQLMVAGTALDELGPTGIEQQVPLCRIDATANENTTKITVAMNTYEHRALVLAAMGQMTNANYKGGGPPPGFMEEEVGAWIQQLRGARG